MSNAGFYTVGGTVQAGSGVYLPRQADEELLVFCRESIFAYVLTPRQLGKSSLMVRTAEQLRAEGIVPVVIDLQQFGTTLTAQEWYLGLLTTFEDQLDLDTDVIDWWEAQPQLGLTQRLTLFFETVLLQEVAAQVVVFVDEIDTTLSLAFTDDFYAAIRFLYTARAQKPEFRRLSFVLVGVATPTDLIRDPKRTPFNIGQRVDLTDFSLGEAYPLARGLGATQGPRVLQWVFDWTGGHPYLTQRLCAALVQAGREVWTEAAVAAVVQATFFGEMSDRDSNLQFVRDMLRRRSSMLGRSPALGVGTVLDVYLAAWQGKTVIDEEQSLIKSHLKLAGVVVSRAGQLRVRNTIYRRVFDKAWVRQQRQYVPVDWWKQLRRIAVSLGILFLVAPAPLAVFAFQQWQAAESAQERAEKARDDEKKQRMLAEDNQAEAQKQQLLAEKQSALALRAKAEAEKLRNIAEGKRKDADASRTKAVNARIAEKEQRLVAERERQAAVAARGEEARQRQLAELKTAEAEVAQLEAVAAQAEAEEQREIAREQGFIARANLSQAQYLNHQGLDALLTAVKLGKEIKQSPESLTTTKILATANLREIVYGIREQQRLQPKRLTRFSDVAFSPDGEILALASGGGTVKLWNRDGEELETLEGYSNSAVAAAFSSGGEILALASYDGTVKLWNRDGEELATLEGHPGFAVAVDFSPDGEILALGSNEGTVKLWNWDSKELATLEGHFGVVVAVNFSPDGEILASGSLDGT
ncbi:MAG: AAA-like domain-containing protein, partial [Spirulinaceae cyanobacterium]